MTDVPVSPSPLVVMGDALLSDSDWETVETQSFLSPANVFCGESRRHDLGLKTPPASRRKIMQSLQPSIEAMQENGSWVVEYGGEHRWSARGRSVVARMEQYLEKSDSMRIVIEELESLLGPEDSEVDLRQYFEVCEKK